MLLETMSILMIFEILLFEGKSALRSAQWLPRSERVKPIFVHKKKEAKEKIKNKKLCWQKFLLAKSFEILTKWRKF